MSADRAIEMALSFGPLDAARWIPDATGGTTRDLGVGAATSGRLGGLHRRFGPRTEAMSEWHAHDFDFQLVYVLQGSITVEDRISGRVKMNRDACAFLPRNLPHRVCDVSSDCEVLTSTAPSRGTTVYGADDLKRPIAQGGQESAVYQHDSPEAWVRGAGTRTFFEYRNLHAAELTGGRVDVQLVRTTEPQATTGWHFHSMAQMLYLLAGSADIAYEDHFDSPFKAGDVCCMGAGPRTRQVANNLSAGFTALQIATPAKYDTVKVEEDWRSHR